MNAKYLISHVQIFIECESQNIDPSKTVNKMHLYCLCERQFSSPTNLENASILPNTMDPRGHGRVSFLSHS